jgi:Xaa-Pro aminopeptidase
MRRALLTIGLLTLVSFGSASSGGGAPEGVTCGLGKDFHAGRRAALRKAVGEGVIVFRGLADTRNYLPFHQDKVFWYLTGVESPNAILVMDAASGEEVLYLPAKNTRLETWEGEMWDAGDAWVSELTGFRDVRSTADLMEDLGERIGDGGVVWVSMASHVELAGCRDRAAPYDQRAERDPLDGRVSREEALAAKLAELYGADVRDCSGQLDELRRVKTVAEVEAMRRAAEAGAAAMTEAIRSSSPGVTEDDLASLMTWVQRRAGATGPGYLPIVGSGPNANVLHYSAKSGVLDAGELILLDYAPEVDHYTSDITRSWPIDGKFSPRMAELYDVVLEAQLAGIAAVKPGGTIGDVERACRDVLVAHGFGDLILHGSCHYIGMEVHDVGSYSAKLEPGVAFTVEPGLYDTEAGIGIRIEDVVVVTKSGCDVITAGVPKSRADMTRLVGEKGVLD